MQQIVVGADIFVYVNGNRFSRVFNFSFQAQTPSREIGGIDTVEPLELAPTVSRCQGSIGMYRLHGDGGLEGAGITTPAAELPRRKYFSIMLIDRNTDTVLFRADRCWVDEQQWQFGTKVQAQGTAKFKALSWSNEVQPRQSST